MARHHYYIEIVSWFSEVTVIWSELNHIVIVIVQSYSFWYCVTGLAQDCGNSIANIPLALIHQYDWQLPRVVDVDGMVLIQCQVINKLIYNIHM